MRNATRTSMDLYRASREVIPGGVNSPVRTFEAVGGAPLFIGHGKGCHLIDVEGRSYIDYIGAWGPMILGHANGEVMHALSEQVRLGFCYGLSTQEECELAELVVEMVPSVEMVRLVNSGGEATMSALRLVRGITGRERIVKFAGGYHGATDSVLVEAGSGAETLGVPSSPGVPARLADLTLVADYNCLESVERLFTKHASEIAAVIVEPVAGNMGVVPPNEEFLTGLRNICSEAGAYLIFDEVMTGFRVSRGGAQERYGVNPDITLLGKILGGGLPVGAIGGKRADLEQFAPTGPIYQAGTLSGNPLTTAAGIKTLEMLRASGLYETLEGISAELEKGLLEKAAQANIPVQINRVGSMLTMFFCEHEVTDLESARASNLKSYSTFFNAMLRHGILLPPSQFEAWFVSGAHAEMHIRKTLDAAERSFTEL